MIIHWQPGMTLEQIEKEAIQQAYQFFQKNAARTAIALGISDKTMRTKLEKYEDERIKAVAARDADLARRKEILDRHRGILPARAVDTKTQETAGAGFHSSPARAEMESIAEAEPESPVSLPQREEVQTVLPRQAAGGGHRGRR